MSAGVVYSNHYVSAWYKGQKHKTQVDKYPGVFNTCLQIRLARRTYCKLKKVMIYLF